MFASYQSCPPSGYKIEVPPPKSNSKILSRLQLIHRKYSDNIILRLALSKIIDPIFFGSSRKQTTSGDADLLHFLNMIPAHTTTTPYIIEFEHVSALYNFGDMGLVEKAKIALRSEWCKAIICSSKASEQTLKVLLGSEYHQISKKVHLVYPAICVSQEAPANRAHKKSSKLNILFVGNLCYLKGMEELFMALRLEPKILNKISLNIISNDATKLIQKYPDLRGCINYFQPKFSKSEILEKFYSKADLFMMPTKRDTFGFAIIDALACGLPIISTKQFAIPELIDDGKDGILLELTNHTLSKTIYLTKKVTHVDLVSNPDPLLVDGLRRALREIVDGKYNLEKMGKVGLSKVRPGGKFSTKIRNRQLARIYKKSLSS